MEFFQRPAVLDEGRGEPIEQLRVRGLVADHAEIARRARERLAEVVLPDAVHEDARGERIGGIGDGVGELAATAACAEKRGIFARKNLEKTARRRFAMPAQIAANSDRQIHAPGVGERVGFGRRGRHGLAQALELLLHRGEVGARGFVVLGLVDFFGEFLDRLLRGVEGGGGLAFLQQDEAGLGVVENAGERVVVARGNGVEFVIVTARARHGQPQERTRKSVHAIRQRFRVGLRLGVGIAAIRDVSRTDREEARRDAEVAVFRNEIACDLRAHELIVRQVAVERSDHPVAVAPRLRQRIGVEKAAEAIAIPRDIQPMPAPALAGVRRREQRVHDLREGLRRRIGEKGRDLLRRGRQAGEIEIRAADERALFRGRRGRELRGLQLGQHEAIERTPHPRRVPHGGRLLFHHRTKRPVLRAKLRPSERLLFFLHHRRRRGRILRPDRARFHPLREIRDDRLRQPRPGLRRRHFQILVLMAHRLEQQTLHRLPRNHRVARLPALHQPRARVQPQPALLLFRAVALHAVLMQHGPDARFKKNRVRRARRRAIHQRQRAPDRQQRGSNREQLCGMAERHRQMGVSPPEGNAHRSNGRIIDER